MNNKLGICIPTYNRAAKLEENIRHLIKECKNQEVPIYISDNASQDNTEEIVKYYQQQYEYIYYSKNNENLGFSLNFEKALLMAETKYCWLLGDDDLIFDGMIKKISQDILDKADYDMIVVNGGGYDVKKNTKKPRVKDLKTHLYENSNELIAELAEPMSWISSLIFNRKNVENMNIAKYGDNAFPHIFAIFKFFEKRNINVYWYDAFCVYSNSSSCAYTDNVLQYYGKDWKSIYDGLSGYDTDAKNAFLYSFRHYKRSIGGKVFRYLRGKGLYDYEIYKEYKPLFPFFSHKSIFILWLIAILPRPLFKQD
ncbi:MAG: glycosyltransferase family 2 protein [Acidaminococcaceae bacterium]